MKPEYNGQNRVSLSILWQLPMACFVLAGLTGFLYRWGLLGYNIFGLSLENIRHAHSHLMFFSWAVPLPMYFIIRKVNREIKANEPNILMVRMAKASLFVGLAAYPFFLGYGYRPVSIAGLDLPFSVILSGLVMLCWYGFILGYWKERKYISSDLSVQFFDGALLMLFICSLGAWGVAVVQFSGIVNPLWGKALTHFFLATFTEGWVVMALLGVIYQHLDFDYRKINIAPGLLTGLILFGAPLTFPYGISEGLLSPKLLIAARLGGTLAATGLLLNLFVIIRGAGSTIAWYWKLVLYLLAFKAVAQLLTSVLPSEFWMSAHGLRIFYLHLLLLGAFSMGLFSGLLFDKKAEMGLAVIAGSIISVLVSLIWLTPFWPQALFSSWLLYATTIIAILPALVVPFYWYQISD